MSRTPRMPRISSNRTKALAYVGSGLALAGVAAGTAAAGFAPGTPAAGARLDIAAATAAVRPGHQHDADARHAAARRDADKRRVVTVSRRSRRRVAHDPKTWAAVEAVIARQTSPGHSVRPLPAADELTPVGTSGAQSYMPIGAAQWANAKTIVKQALARHMGLRSAVVAVATAMQESTLTNINYGTSDSLGLFQQRPSCGWGTAAQIMNPVYASDAFLHALRTYQASNPGWASQPLYQTAQGVQGSAYPYAYAKWEAQAASLVHAVTRQVV